MLRFILSLFKNISEGVKLKPRKFVKFKNYLYVKFNSTGQFFLSQFQGSRESFRLSTLRKLNISKGPENGCDEVREKGGTRLNCIESFELFSC